MLDEDKKFLPISSEKNKSTGGLTRRAFVGGMLATGIGLAAADLVACAPKTSDAIPPTDAENDAPGQNPSEEARDTSPSTGASADTSSVFVVRNTDGTDDGIQRLLALMQNEGTAFYQTETAPQGFVAADDVVILKINCQWAQRGGTNTDLLEKVALAVAAHPDGFTGEIIVADNGQAQYGSQGSGGSLDWDETNSADKQQSALDVVNALKSQVKISGSLWDEFTMNRVAEFSEGDSNDGFVVEDQARSTDLFLSYPKFTTEYDTCVSFREGVWNPSSSSYNSTGLKVINLPVLKVHGGYQVTGAVKAYMGTTASKLTNQAAHNSVGTGGMGTQLANTRMPVLNIIDMIWVGVLRGPGTRYDDAVENKMIAASIDPVALDWWCSRNVLAPLVEAAGGDTTRIDPDTEESGCFGYWLELSAKEIRAANFPANRGDAVRVFE